MQDRQQMTTLRGDAVPRKYLNGESRTDEMNPDEMNRDEGPRIDGMNQIDEMLLDEIILLRRGDLKDPDFN